LYSQQEQRLFSSPSRPDQPSLLSSEYKGLFRSAREADLSPLHIVPHSKLRLQGIFNSAQG
jgi:hypothetical protein